MDMTAPAGPRLSDHAFFTKHIDATRPGLEAVPAAAERGDMAEARRRFAAEARASLEPDRFLRIERSFLGPRDSLPGETLEQAAERIVSLKLIATATPMQFDGQVDWYANPTFNDYREWTWQLNRHPEWGVLAQRYRDTGDERFAQSFVKLFRSWLAQTAVEPLDAEHGQTKAWRTIEMGLRMGGPWPWALHAFCNSPAFTDDILVDWYKCVWEHGWRLRRFHGGNNWRIMESNGLAQIGLLYPQFKEADDWKRHAFDRLVTELDAQVYGDGFQRELSTGYHQVNIVNYQWLTDVAAACDAPVPAAFRDKLERMHAVNVKLMAPDGYLPNLNDGVGFEVARLMQRAARLYPERADCQWAATRGRQGAPPTETSIALPCSGIFAMRTGWESDAVWALFDGGPFGYGHQHEDKLSLLLHAHGRPLLTEGGNYAYDDSEMRRYVTSTRAHNTARVDGQCQNRKLHFRPANEPPLDQPCDARWHAAETYDAVEAQYDEGYGPDAARRLTHRRKVIFLKETLRADGGQALGPCLLVVDRLLPSDGQPHEAQLLWHLQTGMPDSTGSIVLSQDAGVANLAIAAAELPGLTVEVVRGQEQPEWQGWRSIRNHQQGEYEPIPTAIYRLPIHGPTRLVTLLAPLRPGEAFAVKQVIADPSPDATEVKLTFTSGGQITLDETDFPL